jgi:hypothetical protein
MHLPVAALRRATLILGLTAFGAGLAGTAGADSLSGITVEAQRQAEKLKHDVNAFVSAAMVKSFDGSLMRWAQPVCPLAAGLNREEGEFVLLRLSNIARSAHAPLASEHCKPNFVVIFARDPSLFLKLLWRRMPRLFDTVHGLAPVRQFIETSRPVRVWYNAHSVDANTGIAITSALAESVDVGMGKVDYPVVMQPSTLGSRLTYPVVRNIDSAIVVVDPLQIGKLNFGQLVDYIGLVGLAEINMDKDLGEAPTILKVFNASESAPPMEMTSWDRALLRSIYSTPQKDRMQLSKIETAALSEITSSPAQEPAGAPSIN